MNAQDQATDLFYTLYLKEAKFTFVFARQDETEAARIVLDCTPHQAVSAKLIVSAQLAEHEQTCLQALVCMTQRLWEEAHASAREYIELHSDEKLGADHDEYGRVIFYMDLDTFSTIM